MLFNFNPFTGNLDVVQTTVAPLINSGSTISITKASSVQDGYLSSTDWNTFNAKLDSSRLNYALNSSAELNILDWNLYNNIGRTASAFYTEQDLTFTTVATGDAGNGINIDYIFHATQSYLTPLVTVLSSTHITVAWYNGPTVSNNPTATQLKAAWDANGGAVAIATVAISGTPTKLQYITGSHLLTNGGDTSPTDGISGTSVGLTFTNSLTAPLQGNASFLLSKDAANREGEGVSTDFQIDPLDKGNYLQVSFSYYGSSGMVFGSLSDIKVYIFDITNNVFIPLIPSNDLVGPALTIKKYTAKFLASQTSVNYRLIIHIVTQNTVAWDFKFDAVLINNILDASTAVKVPSIVLPLQAVSGAVTDHMAVAWTDGAAQWVPATSVYNGDYWGMFGFATNISGGFADIYIEGFMDGFSFGPFKGYNQYVDPSSPGSLTPLPSPFTDTYLIMGKAISETAINIQVFKGIDLIPTKGGILTNAGLNNGTGDQVLAVGANGNVLCANSATVIGIQWAPAVIAAAPFTYTTATKTLTIATATNAVSGIMSAADHTIFSGHAPLASPTFTNDINSSTGNILISTLGKGLKVKTGVNSKLGTAVLVAGTSTVSNTSVTANSRIFLTSQLDGGTIGFVRITAKTVGTSFIITSSSPSDTSTIAWNIIESIP